MTLQKRIIKYLLRHREGVSGPQISAWVSSVRKPEPSTIYDLERVLTELRDNGVIVCTQGLWWLRR